MAIKRLPSTGDVPRSTGVPDSLVPGGEVDSGGYPWAGRTFDHHETAFADDDGLTPEALSSAVASLRSAAADFRAAAPAVRVPPSRCLPIDSKKCCARSQPRASWFRC
ncbi:hypothetical protein [Leucobacter coleopterorum]|uniref:hypothetical protein n=1 Tax=Leucobacter coleopterorum TaxID=2714933 RepID=UPI001FCC9223|nr:hypothetical protein [Leucobacter coleopterorum]